MVLFFIFSYLNFKAMNLNSVRSIIALLVVGTYMLSLIVAIIFPFLKLESGALDTFATYFSKTSGAYTGIVGVIVGYYFARTNANGTDNSANPTSPTKTTPPANPTSPTETIPPANPVPPTSPTSPTEIFRQPDEPITVHVM